MKLIARPTARRKTANAPWRSLGGPQMPSPVRRIAPKPRRCTEISPPSETSPAILAENSFLFTIDLQKFFFSLIPTDAQPPPPAILTPLPKIPDNTQYHLYFHSPLGTHLQ